MAFNLYYDMPKPKGLSGFGMHDDLSWLNPDDTDGMLGGLPTTTKILTIPGKRWGSVGEYLKEFPDKKGSLFMATYPYVGGLSAWDVQKVVTVHKNNIRYAISKQFPLEFSFYVHPKYAAVVEYFAKWKQLSGDERRTAENYMATYGTEIVSPLTPLPWMKILQMPSVGFDFKGEMWQIGGALPYDMDAYNAVFLKFYDPNVLASTLGPPGEKYLRWRAHNWISSQWERVMNTWLSSYIANFEAYSPDKEIEFTEVYGVTDPAQMAPNTISYIVTKDPPPVPDGAWNHVKFWSDLFNKREGLAILQAAAERYPVKVTTRASTFKEDPSFIKKTARDTKDFEYLTIIMQYVFNDFEIEVTPDAKILVRYNRNTVTESTEYQTDKRLKWNDYVGYAIAATALVVTGVGLAAGIAAIGTTAAVAAPLTTVPAAPVGALPVVGTTTSVAGAGTTGGVLSTVGGAVAAAAPVVSAVAPVVATGYKLYTGVVSAEEEKKLLEQAKRSELERAQAEAALAPITAGMMPFNLKTLLLLSGLGILAYGMYKGR